MYDEDQQDFLFYISDVIKKITGVDLWHATKDELMHEKCYWVLSSIKQESLRYEGYSDKRKVEVTNITTLFRILLSIPGHYAEDMKEYIARVAAESYANEYDMRLWK